ncbi:MAG TPA: hypothetical protein VHH92_07345 [Actinomycetota bacterium]|nr:hypothetical protein [Actinomycetota bacterium]
MGTWIVVVSAVVALVTGFLLRTRMPAVAVAVVLVAAGAGVGWGGLLLQEDATVAETIITVVAMAVLVPAHVRIVLGRFGPAGRGQGIRAMADPSGPPR